MVPLPVSVHPSGRCRMLSHSIGQKIARSVRIGRTGVAGPRTSAAGSADWGRTGVRARGSLSDVGCHNGWTWLLSMHRLQMCSARPPKAP